VALFVAVADDVLDGGGLISHDQGVLDWFVAHRSAWLVDAARFVSTFAGFVGLLVLSVAVGLALWLRRWRSVVIAAPLAALVLAETASTVAKSAFGRPRPPLYLREVHVSLAAFPSSHAAEAAACLLATALTLSLTVAQRRWVRVTLLVAALVLTGSVGISRLVLAVHWLTDVVAGWALGTAIALSVVTVLWWFAARQAARP